MYIDGKAEAAKASEVGKLKKEADDMYTQALTELARSMKAMQAVRETIAKADEVAGDREDLKLGNVQKYQQVFHLHYHLSAWATNMGIFEVING